jgi:hypothetical protein
MNKTRDSIKKTWNLQPNQEVEDAFPSAIKPKHLGVSALSKLKAIASRTKTLAAAQALFLDVSKKSDGTPEPFGHKHACSILDTLKSGETSTSKASKAGIKENTTSKSATESITSHNTAPAKVSNPCLNHSNSLNNQIGSSSHCSGIRSQSPVFHWKGTTESSRGSHGRWWTPEECQGTFSGIGILRYSESIKLFERLETN